MTLGERWAKDLRCNFSVTESSEEEPAQNSALIVCMTGVVSNSAFRSQIQVVILILAIYKTTTLQSLC